MQICNNEILNFCTSQEGLRTGSRVTYHPQSQRILIKLYLHARSSTCCQRKRHRRRRSGSEHTMRMGKKRKNWSKPRQELCTSSSPFQSRSRSHRESLRRRSRPNGFLQQRLFQRRLSFRVLSDLSEPSGLSLSSGTWLEGAGPQLGGEVLRVVLLTVTLEDVERLQTHRLQEEGEERRDF